MTVIAPHVFDDKVLKYIARHKHGVSVGKLERRFGKAVYVSVDKLKERGHILPDLSKSESGEYPDTCKVSATPKGCYSLASNRCNRKKLEHSDLKTFFLGSLSTVLITSLEDFLKTVLFPCFHDLLNALIALMSN